MERCAAAQAIIALGASSNVLQQQQPLLCPYLQDRPALWNAVLQPEDNEQAEEHFRDADAPSAAAPAAGAAEANGGGADAGSARSAAAQRKAVVAKIDLGSDSGSEEEGASEEGGEEDDDSEQEVGMSSDEDEEGMSGGSEGSDREEVRGGEREVGGCICREVRSGWLDRGSEGRTGLAWWACGGFGLGCAWREVEVAWNSC